MSLLLNFQQVLRGINLCLPTIWSCLLTVQEKMMLNSQMKFGHTIHSEILPSKLFVAFYACELANLILATWAFCKCMYNMNTKNKGFSYFFNQLLQGSENGEVTQR